MSAPASEGATEGREDDDDVLGFPGDGFVDNTDANPDVLGKQDEEGDDSRMDEAGAASSQGSGKKRKKSAVLAPDAFVTDRIKALKRAIAGSKKEDNEWTKMLRAKLDQQTVDEKLGGDRTFKINQQWVATTPTVTRGETPKWSWFGVLFVLAPYGMLSDKTQFTTVWACACTKGCRKVYEKKGSGWSAIMDHLANAHGIAKDATHPTAISKQQKQARDESKKRALDAGMTEGRFQAICTTWYIIRRLLPFSLVEYPEFRATVHPSWKVIKTETQRNMVAEMYLCMVAAVKKAIAAVIATSLLPPFWINADLWTSKVTKAKF